MYTEDIYSDDEKIKKSIKAYLFDAITKKQKMMSYLNGKITSALSPELQEKIRAIYEENDKCIRHILELSDELSVAFQKLDKNLRDYNVVDEEIVALLVANVNVDDSAKNNVEVADNKEEISENIAENTVNEVANNLEVDRNDIGSEEDTNELVIPNGLGVEANIDESDLRDAVVNNDETLNPVVEIPNSNVNDVSATPSVQSSEIVIIPTVNAAQPVIDTPASENVEQPVIKESVDQDIPQIVSNVDASGNVENNASPEIVETPEVVETPDSTLNAENTVDEEEDLEFQKRVFEKNDVNKAKAILTTGKQVTKLRESKNEQSGLITASGFFNKKEGSSQNNVNGVVEAAPVVDPNVLTTQQQIEQLMTQANDLYQAGKVEESQKLYDQVSQLNQSLKQG